MDICEDHQQYLGFSCVFRNGKRRYFSFSVLAFGLSSACFCFTKLMRPLVNRWRSMGHLSFIYLDNGFGGQPDKVSAAAASIIQRWEFSASGLLCNEEKSHWAPMQVGEWLGFVINTIAMKCFLPDKELSNLKWLLDVAISDGFCTYRFLAKMAGSVISSALVRFILLLRLHHRGILSSFSAPTFSRSLNFGILR